MNTLGETHRRLAELAGAWAGTEQLAPSPWAEGGEAGAAMTFRVAAGGFALVQDYHGTLTAHGVFCVDGEDVLWYWFDSLGYPPVPARGGFAGGGELQLERVTPRGTNRTTFALDGDSLTQRVEVDGLGVLVSGEYRRVSAA